MTRVNWRTSFAGLCLAASSISCVEPYAPPEINEDVNMLVVDGFVNGTDSSALVKLSRATPLGALDNPFVETNALVQIEEENGSLITLNNRGGGAYAIEKTAFYNDSRYRLLISTNGNLYQSDFVTFPVSPPIDEITWQRSSQQEGIEVVVSTHDPTQNSHYYQWTFEETWQYNAAYYSFFEIVNGVAQVQDQNLYNCWTTVQSSEIEIGTSTRLEADVISNLPLVFIPAGDQKLFSKYSIEVKQRVLTKDAYDFWLELKKTTESLGGLFDPLPGQVLGNITNINNPSDPVLGYFSGGFVSKKRIFIAVADLPSDLRLPGRVFCDIDSIPNEELSRWPDINLIAAYGIPVIQGYTIASEPNCMDCRDHGGINLRPPFWQ